MAKTWLVTGATVALLLLFADASVVSSSSSSAASQSATGLDGESWLNTDFIAAALKDAAAGHWDDFMSQASPRDLTAALARAVLERGGIDPAELTAVTSLRQGVEGASPYWGFVPYYEGSALLGGAVGFTTECFDTVTLNVDASVDTTTDLLGLTVTTETPVTANCSSDFVFTASHASVTHTIAAANAGQAARIVLNVSGFTAAQTWLLETRGVRAFTKNATGLAETASIIDTAALFLPMLTKHVDPVTEAHNMVYFNTFTEFKPPIAYRANPGLTGLSEDDIHDGDVLFVNDMDGLGPTESMGEGGTPGHVTVLLRNDAGVLFVCESTDPEIICTPYAEWIAHAAQVPRSVLLAPLKPEYAVNFNRTAAWQFINETVGLRYGYNNFLFGWMDTGDQNFPCIPPDQKRCIVWEHVEFFFSVVEHVAPPLATRFFGQAMNHRVNGSGSLSFAEVLQVAEQRMGLKGGDVVAVVERDDWRYNTTRYGAPVVGRSMVCSAFTCSVLRASGAFAGTPLTGPDGIQCTEQTPWNMLALQLFDPARMGAGRPQLCKDRDPDNANCVLAGHTTFHLGPNSNEKPLTAGTGNHCPGIAPFYNRSLDC